MAAPIATVYAKTIMPIIVQNNMGLALVATNFLSAAFVSFISDDNAASTYELKRKTESRS